MKDVPLHVWHALTQETINARNVVVNGGHRFAVVNRARKHLPLIAEVGAHFFIIKPILFGEAQARGYC